MTPTATLTRQNHYDPHALVMRRYWRLDLNDGRRKITATRREALEWCVEHDVIVTSIDR